MGLTDRRELPARLVDVGSEDLNAIVQFRQVTWELPALSDVLDHVVGVGHDRREHGGHELSGVVRLQPGGVVGNDRIRGRVREVETVPSEGLDLLREGLRRLLLHASLDRLRNKLPELLPDERGDLLAHRLTEHIGLGQVVAAQDVRDPHHLLLVHDDAVRGLEYRLEVGMVVTDLLPACFPPDVGVRHA